MIVALKQMISIEFLQFVMNLGVTFNKHQEDSLFNCTASESSYSAMYKSFGSAFDCEMDASPVKTVEELKEDIRKQTTSTHHAEFVNKTIFNTLKQKVKDSPTHNFTFAFYVKPIMMTALDAIMQNGVLTSIVDLFKAIFCSKK